MDAWTDPDRRVAWIAALVLATGLSLFMSAVIYGYTGPLELGTEAVGDEQTASPAEQAAVNRTGVGELPRSVLGEVGNTVVIGGGLLGIAGSVLYATRRPTERPHRRRSTGPPSRSPG